MNRAGVRQVLGLWLCIGPVAAVSGDLVPVSQERSVSAQAGAGSPPSQSGDSHSASDFGPFVQGATASASASPMQPNLASSGGSAGQNSQISATLVTSSGAASAGASSQMGSCSSSSLSHFQLVFNLTAPQRVTLDGSVTNNSPIPFPPDPNLTDGGGDVTITLGPTGGSPLYMTGSGPPIPPGPVNFSYSAVLPAGQYTLLADATASAAETHFGPLTASNAAGFTYQFTVQVPEPAALASMVATAVALRRRRGG